MGEGVCDRLVERATFRSAPNLRPERIEDLVPALELDGIAIDLNEEPEAHTPTIVYELLETGLVPSVVNLAIRSECNNIALGRPASTLILGWK
jgi:hypothetical protein